MSVQNPGRGSGCSRFQLTRMVEWEQKSKPKKIPRASNKTPKNPLDQNLTPKNPNFQTTKISKGTMPPGYTGTITNLQIVLNTPKNPYLNQATQKNTCQNFPTPKNPEIEKFKPQRILWSSLSFDHSCPFEVHPPGVQNNCHFRLRA